MENRRKISTLSAVGGAMGRHEPGHRAIQLLFRRAAIISLLGGLGCVILSPIFSTAQTACAPFSHADADSTCFNAEHFQVRDILPIDPAKGRYMARSPSQGFTVWFSHRGIDIRFDGPHQQDWRLRLELDSWGSERGLQPALRAMLWAEGREVGYCRTSITELYRNGPQGLEQVLSIDSFPPRDGRFLTLQMAVDGNLHPRLDKDRRVVVFDGPRPLQYTIVKVSDGVGRGLPSWIELRGSGAAERLRLVVDTEGAVPPFTVKTTIRHLVKLLPEIQDEAKADFGDAVAVDGDVAIVGEPHYGAAENSGHTGAAFVYYRDSGGRDMWGRVAQLKPANAPAGGHFGSSVAISGDIAIVGAPGPEAESAYVFMRNLGSADNWGQVTTLNEAATVRASGYGTSVAISGHTAIVGAPGEDSAFIYKRPRGGPNQWGRVATIRGIRSFGWSVSISGDTAVVGAPHATVIEDGRYFYDAGCARVFERNQGGPDAWGEVAQLVASDPENEGLFGISVALDRNTVIAGAMGSDYSPGSAYVFERNGRGSNVWHYVRKLVASEPSHLDNFGHSVSLKGGLALVGAAWGGALEPFPTAHLFGKNRGGVGAWGEVAKMTPPGGSRKDLFGFSVSLSGDTIVVGAPWDEDRGEKAGSAYVYRLFSTSRRAGARRNP